MIRYKWASQDGIFPDYEKLIPTDSKASVHFDTSEAVKALNALKALANAKAYPIDLTLGNGKLIMASPDDRGQAEVNADTEGEVKIRIDGKYFAEVLKACGGMVELKLQNAYFPMLFGIDGYQVVVMPMFTEQSKIEQGKAAAEANAEAKAKGYVDAEQR